MIDSLVSEYESKNHHPLDLSECYLCASIQSYFNSGNVSDPVNTIEIIIDDDNDEIYLTSKLKVLPDSPLYEPFKKYFMQQLEKAFFTA